MLDLLAATAVLLVIVAVGAAALVGMTVVPFVLATDLAEARRGSTARAGALALGGIAVGLGLAFAVVRSDLPSALVVLPLALCWAVPLALWLTGESEGRVVGRQGHHEP